MSLQISANAGEENILIIVQIVRNIFEYLNNVPTDMTVI